MRTLRSSTCFLSASISAGLTAADAAPAIAVLFLVRIKDGAPIPPMRSPRYLFKLADGRAGDTATEERNESKDSSLMSLFFVTARSILLRKRGIRWCFSQMKSNKKNVGRRDKDRGQIGGRSGGGPPGADRSHSAFLLVPDAGRGSRKQPASPKRPFRFPIHDSE
jgi:hypothetical protein